MRPPKRIPIKVFLALLAAGLVGLVVILTVTRSSFKVTGTTPRTSEFSYSSPFIDIHFNKPIDQFTIGPADFTRLKLKKDDYTIRIFINNLAIGNTYTILLQEVTATDKSTIRNHKITFKTRKIMLEKMDEQTQKALLDYQQSGKGALSDPLHDVLPHYAPNYELRARITAGKSKPDVLFVYQPTVADRKAGARARQAAIDDAKKVLANKGISMSEYELVLPAAEGETGDTL